MTKIPHILSNIVKTTLFCGSIFIILFFIYNSLQYIDEQTSVVDSILKPIGIKEYTHEELVNKVKINTDDNHLIDVIKSALFNTDNNTLKYIKSISVVSRDKVSEICEIEVAMGCADMTYKDKRIYDANIYLSNLSGYIGMCGSFSHSLYHEIGHVNYVYNNNYIDYTHIQYELKPDEIYANNYANNFSKEKCNSLKYLELDRIEKETREQLRYWDRYGAIIPYELYEAYQRDYNANIDAIDNYENYMNSDKDIINPQ